MSSQVIKVRNIFLHLAYKNILKPVFFMHDPETVHDRMVSVGVKLGNYSFTRNLLQGMFGYENKKLEQTILGISFKNPVGLSAGFDKNAELTDIIPSVGFGFIEIGSITGKPCEGNSKPRLWRLPKSKGLVVYYGLKNLGAKVLANRLRNKHFKIPLGTSIAITNCAENLEMDAAIVDYKKAFEEFVDIGDYFTVNISCPNAQGGQPFIDPSRLDALFK